MKVVAINGSPRKGGNTETLLREALKPLQAAGWESSFIQLGGAKIRGCIACYKCFENKDARCAVKTDVANDCLAEIFAADAVIMGSPTYFTDVTAELKALIDRAGLVAIANGGLLYGKIGAAVIAVRRGGGTHAYDSINHMYLMSGMVVPGSSYWNLGYGLNPGDVGGDAEGLRNMHHLGQSIACLGKALATVKGEYPGMPAGGEG
ncbi:flavodoxin family protein [Fundidesulfovibrio terrae]|uniref:flavodoxin family protein n=1 Tax=Fundidesulfovibrio terrae TaxID=2922866 RepID=UPI001FAF3F48|nr:flavodoxin family protein [Fundidesulfovibrio terrae]